DVREFPGTEREGEGRYKNAARSLDQNLAQASSKSFVKASILVKGSADPREQELTRGFAGVPELKDYPRPILNLLLRAIAGPTCRYLRETASIDLRGREELSSDDVVRLCRRFAAVATGEVLAPHPGHRRSMWCMGLTIMVSGRPLWDGPLHHVV